MADQENPNEAREEEQEEESEEESEEPGHEKVDEEEEPKPGFSFSKSAIADLPSTAVQSIHIENDSPVEVDDDVFVWHDTKSRTKNKIKVKKKYQHKTVKHTSRSPLKIALPPVKQKMKKTTSTEKKVVLKSVKKVTSKGLIKKQSCISPKPKSKVCSKRSTPKSLAPAIKSTDRVKERRSSHIKSAVKSSLQKIKSKARSNNKMGQSNEKKTSSQY